MKKPEITFDTLPSSAISKTTLKICLKCAFDVFTKQLKLTPRTAYSELKRHVPEEPDITGAATSRPHFFDDPEIDHCPYCNGTKRWFADFHAIRIDAHPTFEKERKKLWAALKKQPERFAVWSPERTKMQIFSEWLERLNRSLRFDEDRWLLDAAISHIKRSAPSNDWEKILTNGVRRVQLSRQVEEGWRYEDGWLYVSPSLYGDVIMVQHLISRSHQHGGRTFEGRLTFQELIRRLRRIGYFEAKDITSDDPYEEFEFAVSRLVDSGPAAVYYAVDRKDYLDKLKAIYDKKKDK
ncbi:MAG TPA: hypothetical protein VKN18_19820 [Blastocatellia bacterium]|nr:hypothetical protein [Blastocatellia bacterium]